VASLRPRWRERTQGLDGLLAVTALVGRVGDGEQRIDALANGDRVEYGFEQLGITSARALASARRTKSVFSGSFLAAITNSRVSARRSPSALAMRAPRSSTLVPAPPNFCPARSTKLITNSAAPAPGSVSRSASSNSCAYSSMSPSHCTARDSADTARRAEPKVESAATAQAKAMRAPSGAVLFGSSSEIAV